MSTYTYVQILKYLKINKDMNVRILWWEPLLFPKIWDFIRIAKKGAFDVLVFSNINIPNKKIIEIFKWIKNITINCNINNKSFYTSEEIQNLKKNLVTFNELWIKITLWYNIIDINLQPDLLLILAKEFNINNINLKITNSSLGSHMLIDNSQRSLWKYIYDFILKNHKKHHIYMSCGLSKDIFISKEIEYISNNTDIILRFGCDANGGKMDFNTDGSIFKCYPLEKLFLHKPYTVSTLLKGKKTLKKIIQNLNVWLISTWECTANKYINKNPHLRDFVQDM